jgi:hypothetical protein
LILGYVSGVPDSAAKASRKMPRKYSPWFEFPVRVGVVIVVWIFWPFTALWRSVMPRGPLD